MVTYKFFNRNISNTFNQQFLIELKKEIQHLSTLKITRKELEYLNSLGIFSGNYLKYLSNFKFNPDDINFCIDENNQLQLTITGTWLDTILWEVPLMAIISELYFKIIDTNWNYNNQIEKCLSDISLFSEHKCTIIEFGTRRRRNSVIQNIVMGMYKNYDNFYGTSNPLLAMTYNVPVKGTIAHELICCISELESLNHPNRIAMQKWQKVYGDSLSIFLPDTYGMKSFLNDFTSEFVHNYKGVRHDSGDPIEFTNMILQHYDKYNINYSSKTIIYSDSLNPSKCIEILKHFENKDFNKQFGIGTYLTNHGFSTPALNMVIKVIECNNKPVCKLSNDPGKSTGDPQHIELMKKIHF
jgi:nicotinate phosphoribosyltransferase